LPQQFVHLNLRLLADDFEDCVAAQTFIYFDACISGGLGEVASSPSGHTIVVTCCQDTPTSYGYDIEQYKHGAWTYYFLIKGLMGTGHEHYDIATNFTWSHSQYHDYYTVTGFGYPEFNWIAYDQPDIFDSSPVTSMYL
jgi:hypothetical protein